MSGWLFLDSGDSRVYPNLYNSVLLAVSAVEIYNEPGRIKNVTSHTISLMIGEYFRQTILR